MEERGGLDGCWSLVEGKGGLWVERIEHIGDTRLQLI